MTSRLLYLVRHGEYDDAGLTGTGREQFRLIGARLALCCTNVARMRHTAAWLCAEKP